jgi:anti-anti-sigma regulatory factor
MSKQRIELELPPDFADCGSLNWQTLSRLRLVLLAAANATTSPILVVNLTNVQRGGAALMSTLLEARRCLHESGRWMTLKDVPVGVTCVLEACRLTNLFSS